MLKKELPKNLGLLLPYYESLHGLKGLAMFQPPTFRQSLLGLLHQCLPAALHHYQLAQAYQLRQV
jgi:hypothetical protein